MHDMLQRLVGGGATLDQDAQFKLSRESGGDAFYFSNLAELFSQPGTAESLQASETGYVRRTRSGTVDLQFSKSGDPGIEKSY
jgi:hypothetical protein